ncbi:MAG: GNAT family N-acetyltransferase, partial [Vicinamibacteria bacterium]
YQGRGLGRALLKHLLATGRDEGIQRIIAEIATENGAMQAVCRKLGFRVDDEVGGATRRAVIETPA